MFSLLRNRLGVPGLISVIALVFAMSGGAFAAKDYLSEASSSAAKQNKAGKPGPRGPRGKPGPAGPAGPVGPTGPAGSKGDKGDTGEKGAKGDNGTNGTNGTSVVSSSEATGTANCEGRGGAKFVAGASTTFACNGEEGDTGPPGPEGVCSTANCVLPGGAVLKGAWVLPPTATTAADELVYVPITTGIKLGSQVVARSVAPGPANPSDAFGCTGTAENPTIAPTASVPAGFILLCVYPQEASNIKVLQFGPGTKLPLSGGGAVVAFRAEGAGTARAWGSWVLKAP